MPTVPLTNLLHGGRSKPKSKYIGFINRLREELKLEITSTMVKELRVKTGTGMMDCKEALIASNGDFEKAIDNLIKELIRQIEISPKMR